MDSKNHIMCCGCLSSGRKMLVVNDYWEKQCFLQIISEISMFKPETEPLLLCWECEAQLRNFTKFKQNFKHSYKILNDYLKQNESHKEMYIKPRLTTHQIVNISISSTTEDIDNHFKDIKPENSIIHEYDDTFNTHSDDEKLIELSTKSQNGKVKKKKKKYSEVQLNGEDDLHKETKKCNKEVNNKCYIKQEKNHKKLVINGKIKKKKSSETEIYTEVELSREELEEERRMAVLNEDYVNAMFKCGRCIVCFANAEDLKDHIHLKHELNASKLKCEVCECSFASEVSYNYHASKHARRYECTACTARSASKRAAAKHYEQYHCHGTVLEFNIPDITLDNNQKVDNSADGEDKSMKQASSFPCELCDKSFRWKTSLRKHVETHRIETGQKRKPYCEPCGLTFTATSNLQKHVKTSSKHQIQLKLMKLKDPVAAGSPAGEAEGERGAGEGEEEQARIERIKCAVNSARQVFPCPQCDKRFQWRGNMLRHVHSHAARAKGELVCAPCNRTFSSIATYTQHMKISRKHVSENDFKYMCSDCGKRFANKTRLKDHINWEHLKNYEHTCSECQKIFKSHTSLYLHKQVVHKKDNAEHLCHHCGKAFPNQAKLRVHVRSAHSGGAAYACGACGARFSWLSCLSRHARRAHNQHNT